MLNRKQSSTAVSAPPAAGAHDLKAGELAALDAKATAALVVFGAVVAGAGWGWSATGEAGVMAVAVVGLPALAYGVSALRNAGAERRRFYAQEVRDRRDYDRDGVIGDPRGHVVNVQGAPAFVLPDLHPETPAAPPPALIHFPVTANDVLFVLDKASSSGLGFRAWEGQRLPSGVKLDRATWGAVQDGMLAWRFATARQTKTGRVVELRTDIDVEAMKDAVRKGAGEP